MKIIRITPGLGNQMFQYALLLNYKLKGEDIFLDLAPCKNSQKHNKFELGSIFGIKYAEPTFFQKLKLIGPSFYIKSREITFLKLINKILTKILNKRITLSTKKYIIEKESDKEFNFNKEYLEVKNDVYFDGYFNSYKYFENIKEEIKKIFRFPEFKDEKNIGLLLKIKESESVSIHIRRGDYLSGVNLNICDKNYFENAFNYIKNTVANLNIRIFIFSDDIEWCRNNLNFLKDYENIFVDWNKKADSYKDMQLMSECKHNIIPNSTFSWWAAYLNKNPKKIVVAPKYWFKNVKTTGDRCEKGWHLV